MPTVAAVVEYKKCDNEIVCAGKYKELCVRSDN